MAHTYPRNCLMHDQGQVSLGHWVWSFCYECHKDISWEDLTEYAKGIKAAKEARE